MKIFKTFAIFSLVITFVSTIIQCTSMPKLEKEAPITFKAVYYQKWNAGTQEGGSGTNVYIEASNSSIVLDSIYFRGEATKLKQKANNHSLYVGRFKSKLMESKDLPNWPFQIKDNECVISYSEKNEIHYFKISNINERESINYPSAPSNKL